jgi:hypothetical protein
MELKERVSYLKRFAMVTITDEDAKKAEIFHLSGSKPEEIDCIVEVDQVDIDRNLQALDCYVTFQETIEKTKIKDFIGHQAVFEVFQESHDPPLNDLFNKLPE